MALPIVLSFLFCGLLFFLGHLATQQAHALREQLAPTRIIMRFSLLAIAGNLLAVGIGVFGIFLLSGILFS